MYLIIGFHHLYQLHLKIHLNLMNRLYLIHLMYHQHHLFLKNLMYYLNLIVLHYLKNLLNHLNPKIH